MHLTMILAALGLAWLLGWSAKTQPGVGANAIHAIVISVSSAATDNDGLAVLCMGPQGQMIGAAGRVVQLLACSRFRVCRSKMPQLAWSGWCSVQHLSAARHWGRTGRILDDRFI